MFVFHCVNVAPNYTVSRTPHLRHNVSASDLVFLLWTGFSVARQGHGEVNRSRPVVSFNKAAKYFPGSTAGSTTRAVAKISLGMQWICGSLSGAKDSAE